MPSWPRAAALPGRSPAHGATWPGGPCGTLRVGFAVADIDECALPTGGHICSYRCINVPGSFQCSCPSSGYRLAPNGRNCQGELAGLPGLLRLCLGVGGSAVLGAEARQQPAGRMCFLDPGPAPQARVHSGRGGEASASEVCPGSTRTLVPHTCPTPAPYAQGVPSPPSGPQRA